MYYVVKRGKSVIAIVAFTTALLVRTTALASDDVCTIFFQQPAAAIWHSIYFKSFFLFSLAAAQKSSCEIIANMLLF